MKLNTNNSDEMGSYMHNKHHAVYGNGMFENGKEELIAIQTKRV